MGRKLASRLSFGKRDASKQAEEESKQKPAKQASAAVDVEASAQSTHVKFTPVSPARCRLPCLWLRATPACWVNSMAIADGLWSWARRRLHQVPQGLSALLQAVWRAAEAGTMAGIACVLQG